MKKRLISWRPLLGVVLIAISATSVALIVSSSRQVSEVLVAARSIAPGEEVSRENTEILEVPLSPVWDTFASSQDAHAGLSSTVLLNEGDVIPLSGLASETLSDDAVVSVLLSVGSPRWLAPGSAVDVWVAAPGGENSFLVPFIAADGAVIVDVRREEGFAADSQSSQVDVAIPRRSLPGMVHALANNYFIYVTPQRGSTQ